MINRRNLLLSAAALGLAGGARAQDQAGQTLSPWRRGCLDIHHIAVGGGVSTLIIGPGGERMMIDAGASKPSPDALDPPMKGRREGEWIGRYAIRQLKAAGLAPRLDYLMVTHLHPDHLGDLTDDAPPAPGGGYRLTGVSDVAALLPIGLIVDRGYPDYALPIVDRAGQGAAAEVPPFLANYIAFMRAREKAGGKAARFRVGAADQFAPFDIRNLAANGVVWTGKGNETRAMFPAMQKLTPADIPEENAWSAAIRLRLGRFGYFAAGDLTTNDFDGTLPWRNVETPAALACGPVSVAVAAHHGMFDATSADVVRALKPRVWVVPSWHSAHPSMDVMERMFSTWLYPGPRDIFATGLTQANITVNRRLTDRFASRAGHVVIRVEPGGGRYRMAVTDNSSEADRITGLFGPFDA